MTVVERGAYAARIAAGHLRGGGWIGYAPLAGGSTAATTMPGPGLGARLRQASRVLRAAWKAAGKA